MKEEKMGLLEEIQQTLRIEDKKEQNFLLGHFDTSLEFGSLSNKEAQDIIYLLLGEALNEKDILLQETMFELIFTTVIHQHVGPQIQWDSLVAQLPLLPINGLVYAIDILGWSEKKEYIPLIEKYIHHPHLGVQLSAHDALADLKYLGIEIPLQEKEQLQMERENILEQLRRKTGMNYR